MDSWKEFRVLCICNGVLNPIELMRDDNKWLLRVKCDTCNCESWHEVKQTETESEG